MCIESELIMNQICETLSGKNKLNVNIILKLLLIRLIEPL